MAGNFQNLKVYVNGSLFGTVIQNPNNNTSYTFYSQSGAVTLTAGQLTPLEVYADVSANVSVNQSIVSLNASGTYVQTGDNTQNGSTITQLPASITGQTVVVQSANSTNAIQITVTASANPSTITAGQVSTISWNSTNAIECGFSYSPNIPANPGNGAYRPSDSAQFTPPQTTDYTITCWNSSGQSSSAVVRVNVTAATTQPSITVTSPNGGEQWIINQTYNISWNIGNTDRNKFVSLVLAPEGLNCYEGASCWTIAVSAPNTGSFSWANAGKSFLGGPAPSAPAGRYKINIIYDRQNCPKIPGGYDSSCYDESDNTFTFADATTGSIQISNLTMPNGVVGQPYAGTIGWSAPNISPTTDITVTIDRVGNNNYPLPYFPDGLTLSPNCLAGAPGSSCVFWQLRNNSNGQGQISIGGTPTQAGTYTFTVTVRESQNNTTDTKTVTMIVSPTSASSIQIDYTYMPNGKVGQSYYGYVSWITQNIPTTANITISISNSSALPFIPGLTLSPNGISGAPGAPIVISGLTNATGQGQLFFGGVPTQAGTYTFTVNVQDDQNHSSSPKTITMTVAP